MKFIKKHKVTSLIIVIFIILVILLFFAFKLFFTNSSSPKYGDRLDGIEQVEITDNDIKKIESSIKENKNVTGVSTNISGRTLDITITVVDSLSITDAKAIGQNSFAKLEEKQILYYAIQVFIKKSDVSKNNFPIIGYKQKEIKALAWTKDRKVTTTDETK